MLPLVFIERNQNAFPHVCAWKYLMRYSQEPDPVFQLDHFTSKVTPAWRALSQSGVEIQIFYSGDECNPLIATADITLRLVQLFQHGVVDGRSLLSTVSDRVPVLEQKLRFHNLGSEGGDIHHTAPVIDLDISLEGRIKRPVYYILWMPEKGRGDLEHAFEWGTFYNGVMAEAMRREGCVKFFDKQVDMIRWDPDTDLLCPYGKEAQAFLANMKEMGYALPPVFRP